MKRFLLGITASAILAGFAFCQDAATNQPPPAEQQPSGQSPTAQPAAAGLRITTLVEGLDNPSGIAVQPETGIVFVSDSGAGRVVKIVNGAAEPVIVEFKIDIYGKGPQYNIGPLGLLFLDKNTLVVGGGDLPDGEEKLYLFDLTDMKEPLKAEAAKAALALPAEGEIKGEGNFYALTAANGAVFVTCNGDDTKGWVSRAAVDGNMISDFKRYLPTKEKVEVDAPVGITTSPKGELVVGQMGEINVPNDSLLSFYKASDGALLLNLKTELHDITSLAYSPRGKLYALDFAWLDTTQGGLFQLLKDDAKGMRTKKMVAFDKPTAMAFGPDGSLYVTVIGPEAKKGSVQRIDPGL